MQTFGYLYIIQYQWLMLQLLPFPVFTASILTTLHRLKQFQEKPRNLRKTALSFAGSADDDFWLLSGSQKTLKCFKSSCDRWWASAKSHGKKLMSGDGKRYSNCQCVIFFSTRTRWPTNDSLAKCAFALPQGGQTLWFVISTNRTL